MKNTALETTNFDFYGDELIAVQDNATGEVYTFYQCSSKRYRI